MKASKSSMTGRFPDQFIDESRFAAITRRDGQQSRGVCEPRA